MKKIYKILTGSFAASLILTATVVTPIECIRNSSNNCQTNAINVDHNKNQLNKTNFTNSILNKQISNIKDFISINRNKIQEIYKFIYSSSSISNKSKILSTTEIKNRYKKLPNNLKTFVKNFSYKMNSLKQSIYNSKKSNINDLNLWCDEWDFWTLNVYYDQSDVPNYINFLEYIKNDILSSANVVGSISNKLANKFAEEDNEYSDIAASLLEIYGTLLKLVSKIGDDIINNMLNTLNIAQNNGEGCTTHWLFGFIYLGSSLGNNEWWI